MWCLVSQPNAVILEVEVDPKAKGQECLEKMCKCLGISRESDYFGLKYHSQKGEELWLNLRNPIERQVGGMPPYRFALRVKFWVPPHLLLQEATRHQFYLNARLELVEGRLRVIDWDSAAKLVALIAQAENGDALIEDVETPYAHHLYYARSVHLCGCDVPSRPADFLQKVYSEHCELKNMKPATAEYWVLKEISLLPGCGEELFHTRLLCGAPGPGLGVGPHGLTIYRANKPEEKESVPYSAVVSTASNRRQVLLRYLSLDRTEHTVEVKLESSQGASGVYRAITEKHAFYSCETVRDAVTTQFIRDLKGTIASIFKEDSTLGLKYMFDIRRTCREVYDNARRALYQTGTGGDEKMLQIPEKDSEFSGPKSGSFSECRSRKCEESRDRLSHLLEAVVCRICMDRGIDTAFFPCAHVLCCGECAKRCEICPLCRASIDQAKHIFLPLELLLPSTNSQFALGSGSESCDCSKDRIFLNHSKVKKNGETGTL